MSVEPNVSVILGLPFHAYTMTDAVAACEKMLTGTKPYYCITANVDFVAQAYSQEAIRPIFFYAERVFCDGMPLVWLSHLLGGHIKKRITGADLTPKLLSLCEKINKRVYFLGSDEITLTKAIKNIKTRYPNLQIAGFNSPPMSPIDEWNNQKIIDDIRTSQTDLLLIALGCPKQELWISRFHKQTQAHLSIGIGASLQYIAYPYQRAPKFLQNIGLEWAWRLFHEPNRLFIRYLKDTFYLFWITLKQYRNMKGLTKNSNIHVIPQKLSKTPFFTNNASQIDNIQINWSGKVERATLHLLEQPYDYTKPIIVTLTNVTFIDSSGLGLLAKMARQAKQAEVPFCLFRPSKTIENTIYALRLNHAFPIFHEHDPLKNYIQEYLSQPVS